MLFEAHKLDEITNAPDFTGNHGRAWRCNISAIRERLGVSEEDDSTLGFWLMEAQWAHPVWHSYLMVLVHLRPMRDKRPTKFYLDGATHEMWLYALNPAGNRQKVIDGEGIGPHSCQWLTPMNFAAQFIELTDELATARCEDAVQKVCDGKLSPDTDFIRHWMHLFGDNMIKDKRHAGETRIIGPGIDVVIPARPGPQDMH